MIKHMIYSNFKEGYNCFEECRDSSACDCNNITLQDEIINLNKDVDGRILGVAQVGTWRGIRRGYYLYSTNINSILSSEAPMVRWYSDGKNIRADMTHHDGRNHVLYRVIKEDKNIEKLLATLYIGKEVTGNVLGYYTKSLHPYVADIYGWG